MIEKQGENKELDRLKRREKRQSSIEREKEKERKHGASKTDGSTTLRIMTFIITTHTE